jgi:diguanylate cyclase
MKKNDSDNKNERRKHPKTALPNRKATILLVDDRPENLTAMEKILKPLDALLIKANSGNEAIAFAFDYDFAVILLDVQMPEMDGFETAALLRENERSKHVPIVFVTAINKEQSNVFEGYDSGAVDYLFKPIDPRILKNKVNIFIELYNEKHNQLKEVIVELEATKSNLEKSNQELKKLARNDPLTHLPNRRQFEEATKQLIQLCKSNNQQFALLLVDLDNFKTINDTLGHDVGDIVLKKAAKRLLTCVRSDDFVARLGGDEFAVLLVNLDRYHLAGKIADKIIKATNAPYKNKEHVLHAGASIGIACYPVAGTDMTSLIKHADIALYQAKAAGRNCTHYFTERLEERHKHRTDIEKALHFAIDHDELYLVYQPVFNIKTKRVTGFEALLRWKHPEMGLVSPAEFIPISEEIGLANRVGEWVLNNACRQFSCWYKSGYQSLRFALNLSVCQLLQSKLLETITQLNKTFDLPAELLVLEITETALMHQEKKSMELLEKLNGLGFQISIDDFGTGYSSLSRLQKMPIKILKIDQSFTQNIGKKNDEIIIKAIISLARNLNLDVVAEGVETKEQETFLIKNNCLIVQGFLYSKPLSVEDATALLKQNTLHPEEQT